jgi:dienelactone hydrolase
MKNLSNLVFLISLLSFPFNFISAQYAIGEIDVNGAITDPARSNRTIWTHYYYPATSAGTNTTVANGQFPLIVFGHGFVMAYSEYKSIADSLVSKGYVVVFPRTEGNLFSTNHENFAKDISFLVDYFQIQSQTNASFKLYGKLIDKTAIMGHSMGGGASAWSVANNSRVTTMCTLAPVNTSDPVQSVVWAPSITKPSLIVTGSQDCVADGSQSTGNGDDIYDAMTNALLPYKYTVKITDANHCNFASNPGTNCTFGESTSGCRNTNLTLTNQQKITFKLILPWLNYHLKDDCEAWTIFSDYINTQPATVLTKRNMGALPLTNNSITSPVVSACINDGGILLTANETGMVCDRQWFLNGNIISGANSLIYNATQSGVYSYSTSNAEGVSTNSNTITIEIVEPINPVITGVNSFCSGFSTSLSFSGVYDNINWSLNGNTISGANLNTYDATQAGTYTVIASQNNCPAQSIGFNVIENIPTTPSITINNGVLISTTSASYQWYVNGNIIQGADAESYIPIASGTYYVITTDSNGCLAQSNSITINITGLNQMDNLAMNISPNPTSDYILLEHINGKFSYSIYDVNGKLMLSGKNEQKIDVHSLLAGIYQVQIQNNGRLNNLQFVKK